MSLWAALRSPPLYQSPAARQSPASLMPPMKASRLPRPPPTVVFVCHGFGCKYRAELDLTGSDRAKLAQLLEAGKSSAAAERKAVGVAGAWFNTTSLLLVLDQLNLLRYHDVDVPEARGYVVDGRPPHATAVLTEKATGAKWSIESWTVGYGQPLEIMPLERWKTLEGDPSGPIKRNARKLSRALFSLSESRS